MARGVPLGRNEGSVYSSHLACTPPATRFQQRDLRARAAEVWTRGPLAQRWHWLTAFFALLSATVYVVEAYRAVQGELWSKIVEIFIAAFFLADYCLRVFLAEHRFRFLATLQSVVDILCITPAVFVFTFESDGAMHKPDDASGDWHPDADPRQLVFFLQFLRVVRLARLLRASRPAAVSKRGDPEGLRTQLRVLLLTVLTLILVTAVLVHLIEKHAWITEVDGSHADTQHIKYLHDAVYFVVITLTTVGYGDIVPHTIIAKVFISVFVITSVIMIPRETGRLTELMALTSPYAGTYQRDGDDPHVVVCGYLDFANFKAFLTEFFHPAHGQHQMVVVAMAPQPPPKGLRLLCGEGGHYGTRVQYFEGSALDDADLARIRYAEACASFVLVDKHCANAQLADCESVMRVLSMKRVAHSVPVYAQVLLSEGMQQIITAGADHVVCLRDLKMHILATASVVHGFSTLFCNLFRNEGDVQTEEGTWLAEYCHGVSYEVYCCTLPPPFHGRTFAEVALHIYAVHGALMFGIQHRSALEGDPELEQRECLLNPVPDAGGPLYCIAPGDRAVLFATDSDVSDAIADFSGVVKTPEGYDGLPSGSPSWGRPEVTLALPQVPRDLELLSPSAATPVVEDYGLPEPSKRQTTVLPGLLGSTNSAPLSESSTEELPPLVPLGAQGLPTAQGHPLAQCLPTGPEAHDPTSEASSDAFVPQGKYERRILPELPQTVHGHIVLVCRDFRQALAFVAPLRANSSCTPGLLRPVVILTPQVPEQALLRALHPVPRVFLVLGDGRDVSDFRRCNVGAAYSCVILFSGRIGDSGVSYPGDDDEGEDMMADYDGLLAYKCLSAEKRLRLPSSHAAGSGPFSILELIHKQNTRFIPPSSKRSLGTVTEHTDYIVPCYAGGMVFSDAVMDSLLCQVFYNADLLTVLSKFLSPDPLPVIWPPPPRQRASFRASFGSPCISPTSAPGVPGFRSSRVYSIPLPSVFVGEQFRVLLSAMLLRQQMLPIGLFRVTDRGPGDERWFLPGSAEFRFVFLCPPADAKLGAQDRVFVLAEKDPTHASRPRGGRTLG
eukprot:TRINITY_DN7975_c0_g1_i1.p1 TRINITY_DN7975_c0_g1~~TRINITY_DN7975_c0_g1_i1.p1  ORF type:complete len:1066 (+),score=333.58 TRINITY_DN7975_c0_g1_i1:101-3298(+)